MSVEEMEVLLAAKEVTIKGKKMEVNPLSFKNTLKVALKATDIVNSALNNSEGISSAITKLTVVEGTDGIEDAKGVKLIGAVELAGIIGEEGIDFLLEIIKMSVNITDDELDKVDPLEGIEIVEAIYKVNKDFFTKCMNKLFPKVKKETKAKIKKAKTE